LFENKTLRRILELKGKKLARHWEKLHNENLCEVYALPSIVKVINCWEMRWSGHIACKLEMRSGYKILVIFNRRNHF
jgi:hypothetical protein